jgi:hypothetical protein
MHTVREKLVDGASMLTYAGVCIRILAYVSIRCQYADVCWRMVREKLVDGASMLTYAGVCIRQPTPAYVSIRQQT